MKQQLNVRDYDAPSDGLTLATAAIQSVIDTAIPNTEKSPAEGAPA